MADEVSVTAEEAIRHPAFRARITDDLVRGQADLIDIGFATAGSLYNAKNDPNISAAWRGAGANITSILQERWFRKEFESFSDMHLAPYGEKIKALDSQMVERFGMLDTMGQVQNPDGTFANIDPNSPEAEMLKKNWLAAGVQEMSSATNELFDAAAKYGNGNPLIDMRMNQIVGSHAEVIGALTNPQQLLAGQQAQLGLLTERQRPALVKGQAHEAEEHAKLLARTDPNLRAGSERTDPMGISPLEYMQKFGEDEAISLLASGRVPWAQEYLISAREQVEQEEISKATSAHAAGVKGVAEKTGIGPDGTVIDEDKFDRLIASRAETIKRKGIHTAARNLFPGQEERVEGSLQKLYGNKYESPIQEQVEIPSEKIRVESVLSRTRQKQLRSDLEDVGYRAVEQAARRGEINSEEDAARVALEAIDQVLEVDETNAKAYEQAIKIGNEAVASVSAGYLERSPTAREALGKPTLGERVGSIIERGKGIL